MTTSAVSVSGHLHQAILGGGAIGGHPQVSSALSSKTSRANTACRRLPARTMPLPVLQENRTDNAMQAGINGAHHLQTNIMGSMGTGTAFPLRVVPFVRPTRESVLRRLSEALMRRSLTMIDMSQRGLRSSDARLVKLALLQNSSLSVLKLGYNHLGDEGVTTLASGIATHGALSSLDLGFNNVGNEGCIALANALLSTAGTLHTLYLAGNSIGKEGAAALAKVLRTRCGLQRLHLTGNGMGPDGVKAITEAITDDEIDRQHRTLTELHQPQTLIPDTCLQLLKSSTVLASVPPSRRHGLQELFLGGTSMGHLGCKAVARMLAHSLSLRVLSLANCCLGDDDAGVLAGAITENREKLPLEALQLSFNNLTCKGVEPLMNALWGSKTLTELRVDNNSIGNRGVQVVSAVLTSVKTLVKLDLGFNSISAVGMRTLMKAVAENDSLISLSISGNKIDAGSAKAVAYALAYNKSLTSLFLDHCSIEHEGQRHITAGIVSNNWTRLNFLTGFRIGANAVSLGLPAALEQWTNDQVLKFIHLMWERMNQEQEENSAEKELDPLHLLPGPPNSKKLTSGPLDPVTVVAVAKRAFDSLGGNKTEFLSRSGVAREPSFGSPLAEDAIILEACSESECVTNEDLTSQTVSVDPSSMDESEESTNSSKDDISTPVSVVCNTLSTPQLDLLSRKKKIAEWLCHNSERLNKLSRLPFDSSELWRLHQHFFAPCIHDATWKEENEQPALESVDASNNGSYTSGFDPSGSSLSEPCVVSPSAQSSDEHIAASEPAFNATLASNSRYMKSLPLLKRKVSYRFLNEACLASTTRPDTGEGASVSKLIEDMNGHSMQPKSKRARKNRTRISFVPRVKAKLDTFLDSCHLKALVLMRQLQYVERSLLSGNVYSLEGLGPSTHIGGTVAADAELMLLDMM